MSEATPLRLVIDRVGHRGDGVARHDGREIFVSYVLPGEEIAAERIAEDRAALIAVERASAERVDPFCPLFMRCGGCATQHMASAAQLEWKRSLVVAALAQRGIEAPVDPCLDGHGEGRRRVTLHVREIRDAIEAGFMAARSHELVALDHCPILAPGLAAAPRVARDLGAILAGSRKPLDVQATATDGGLDIDIRGHGGVTEELRAALIARGGGLGLARLSLHGETLAEWRAPTIRVGRATLKPPAGGFLQATQAGEEALAGLVLRHIGGARRVADLFSGCGAFSLRIAEKSQVRALEQEVTALDALARAARATPGLRPVATEVRDLFRQPALAHELEPFDAVVFDPPFAGADAQARALAAAWKVGTIVAVSCNPATFARDARTLLDGGYRLQRVTPVDQFRHSPHVEVVAVFRR